VYDSIAGVLFRSHGNRGIDIGIRQGIDSADRDYVRGPASKLHSVVCSIA